MRGLPRSTNSQPGAAPLSAGRRYGETKTGPTLPLPAVNLADCSGSWYHAAAIEESKPVRDH